MTGYDLFLKIISILADVITISTVIVASFLTISKKAESLLAFRINLFLQYLLRSAFILVILKVVYVLTDFLYVFFLSLFKGSWGSNYSWEQGHELSHLSAYFVAYSLGGSIAWILCTLIWTSSSNHTKELLNLFLPKNKVFTKQASVLEINLAIYGTVDANINVTSTVRQMVQDNKLSIKASNKIAGDPVPGVVKTLTINYKFKNETRQISVQEGDTINIPD